MRPQHTRRTRVVWAAVAMVAIASGLASRMHGESLPPFVATYAGDALWATMVYAMCGLIVPTSSIRARALASLTFAFAIECSQLVRTDWLESLRGNPLGALVLGHGFLWSDLACYTAGIAIAAAAEAALKSVARRRPRTAQADSALPH